MKSKILVYKQDIINTYSQKYQLSCRKYFEYLKLVQDNPAIGYKRAAKILGVKQGSTRWWHTEGEKKAIPNPLKVVQKHSSLNNRSYEPRRSVCFTVLKPKHREIFAADFRDRIVHHIIVGALEGIFEPIFSESWKNEVCRK